MLLLNKSTILHWFKSKYVIIWSLLLLVMDIALFWVIPEFQNLDMLTWK
jgi:hypothetical protein